ncbi:hypothetical protein [Paenibacillus koleovorans]|uniref:hypothetical protein n=1 Tax=Paenibacillus koleovorans TaxID=121608 RepID=UPI000FD7527B|nr:hypothetical protein [Paenibacillus koleovorans]
MGHSKARYGIYLLFGLASVVAGIMVWSYTIDVTSNMVQAIPYMIISIGSGVFGQGIRLALKRYATKTAPHSAKQREIDEKDERNIAVRNHAKAKAFDLMLVAIGALLIAYTFTGVSKMVILSLGGTYLIVLVSTIYFAIKVNRSM